MYKKNRELLEESWLKDLNETFFKKTEFETYHTNHCANKKNILCI